MFRTLYGRLMAVFLAVLLMAMGGLSFLLYQRIRDDKIDARLDELTMQARDVAFLAGQRSVFGSAQTDRYLLWKSQEIMEDFGASLLIVDRYRNVIPISDTQQEDDELTLAAALTLLNEVLQGREIRAPLVSATTGNPIFIVGVPYIQDGLVLGAVFIHTNEQSIETSYREILAETLRAVLMAMSIGAFLILLASSYMTRPLRQMAAAAERFSHGDSKQRVEVTGQDEVGRLAESFNSMADDLERLEQTRRDFVANVSHELRSPLTSMQGFINGILDGTVPEGEREHYLNIVLDETRRLNKLITTLLDLSHIENGKTPLSKTRFDINEMICRVLVRQESVLTERSIDVQMDFEHETCYVNADADRIEQVLVNLLDNAIKYGGEHGCITLKTKTASDGVHISVSDTGPGIPEADLPFVFERFYKVDKAHTTGKGTGLGLAIVKSIIEQHGHSIRAFSTQGDGARFEFTLDRG